MNFHDERDNLRVTAVGRLLGSTEPPAWASLAVGAVGGKLRVCPSMARHRAGAPAAVVEYSWRWRAGESERRPEGGRIGPALVVWNGRRSAASELFSTSTRAA